MNLTHFNEDSNELERVLVEAINKLDLDKLKDFIPMLMDIVIIEKPVYRRF